MSITRHILLLAAAVLACSNGCYAKNTAAGFNILDYGAAGDGKTLNTASIQKAIDACAKAGGGAVTVPPGTYVTGAFTLLPNITLHLEPGATIKGSTNLQDYTIDGNRFGLIRAKDAKNIAITGPGTIDGSGTSFMDTTTMRNYPDWQAPDLDPKYTRQGQDYMHKKFGTQDGPYVYHARPGRIIRLLNCKNVLLRDITITDAPSWTVHFDTCKDVTVTGIRIKNSLLVPNSDGIHCTSCKNVQISDCDISGGDDSIAITCIGDRHHQDILGGEPSTAASSENITVSNCTLRSRSAGVRVGYTGGDIKNCTFKNLVVYESNRGLLVNVRDYGSVENVSFSDITIETRLHTGHWWGQAEPIHVSAVPGKADIEKLGQIKNVRFSNIIADCENGIVVFGCEESTIQDLIFENVKLKLRDSPLNKSYGGNIDLRTAADLSSAIFEHDIPGLYARYVDGLKINGLEIDFPDELPPFFNHALHCEYFTNLKIDALKARQPQLAGVGAVIALNNGSNVTINNCRVPQGTDTFLKHAALTGELIFAYNDLSNTKYAIDPPESKFKQFDNRRPE